MTTRPVIAPAVTALLLLGLAACDNETAAVDFRLAGTVRYEDRLYGTVAPGRYGFTGLTRFNPVRHAVIDLVDASGRTRATTRTDNQGAYRLAARAAGPLRLRVLARTDPATGPRISVKSVKGELYATSRGFTPAAGELTLDLEIPLSPAAGAWNILDVCTAGSEFVREQTGAWPPAPLTVWWSPGAGHGTWFSADGIHVLGGSAPGVGDTDEFDDDVLLHEFGHFVERFSGKADSPGGYHVLNDNTQDLRLAWSEGFASYFSGAVKQWLDERRSTVLSDTSGTLSDPHLGPLYLDTSGDGARLHWFFDLDYATRPALDLAGSFATAETSIAKVLWNLTREFGPARLWRGYRTLPNRGRPASIETFRDGWLAAWPGEPPRDAYRQRRIDYDADPFESDDAPNGAAELEIDRDPLPADRRTLHAGGQDADHFLLRLAAGTRYAVETFGLLNGADTLITLHSPTDPHQILARCGAAGTARCENDNASGKSHADPRPDRDAAHRLMLNDGCKLASRLVVQPAVSGNYLVRVAGSPSPSPGAGRYGAYYLKVSRDPSRYRCP